MGIVRPLVVLLTAFVVTACASSQPRHAATIDDSASGFHLAVSSDDSSWVDDLLAGQVDCSSRTGGALGALLAALDRGGPRARASVHDGDGTLRGRRRGNRVELVAGDPDGRLEVRMPWAAAECLLGHPTELAEALDGLEVVLVGDDGHRTRLRLD